MYNIAKEKEEDDWYAKAEEEFGKRRKFTLKALNKKYDIAIASWDDYHEGDSEALKGLVKQMGYKEIYELGYFSSFSMKAGYFFIYSKKKITKKVIKEIKYDLGLDLAEKCNLDKWTVL